MTATPPSDSMEVDQVGTNPTAGETPQNQRRGSSASGAGSSVPGPPPPLPPNSNRGLPPTPAPVSTAMDSAPDGDPQTTPLPPSPAPTPGSRSAFSYPSAAQEKAQLGAGNQGVLNSPPSGGSNAPHVVPAPNTMPGAFADAEISAPPPPSYGEARAVGAAMPLAVYQSNLASPGPGCFYAQTEGGFIPIQNPPPPGINLFILGADRNFYPAPLVTAPLAYPAIPVSVLSPRSAAKQGLLSTPAPDPATASLRAILNPDPRGSPPDSRSSPVYPRVDDENAMDYFNNKDSKTPSARSGRPASISYDPGRGGPQKATRQSSYPSTGHADDDANPDEDLRSSAAAANKYMKRSRELESRMDEDDDDFGTLKPDENLARRQEHKDRLDEEDDEEDDFDDLPDHPPGYRKPPPRRGPKPIFFYEETEKYYEFTNFAPYPVIFRGKEYPTSEHLFQARKFLDHRPLLAEHIRRGSDRPRFAFNEARRFGPETRPDWKENSIKIMDEILELKFTQHHKLRRLLLETGERYLVENAGKYDDFWGNGADGNGRNELGQALMRLRTLLREKEKEKGAPTNVKGKGKLRR